VWAVDVSAVTITKEFRQLARAAQRLIFSHGVAAPLYLRPACPDSNGATLAAPWSLVARSLPTRIPRSDWRWESGGSSART